MNEIAVKLGERLEKLISTEFRTQCPGGSSFDISRSLDHGDLSCTAALRLSKSLRRSPQSIASELSDHLSGLVLSEPALSDAICKIEAQGGFINVWLSRSYWLTELASVSKQASEYGKGRVPKGKANVEFVSANPTGPLTVAHGRQAAIGDTLARILDFAGWTVEREYYLNDTGNQMRILGLSVYLRYRESCGHKVDFPEDCYQGEYIRDIAAEVARNSGTELSTMSEGEAVALCGRYAGSSIMKWIREDLKDFGVSFDTFFSQEKMESSGAAQELIERYRAAGMLYELEGAVWLSTTQFGDSKDRVLVKSDGSLTYRTPDIAYHVDKFARGYSRMAVTVGPDHHAHTITMKAALKALALPAEDLVYLIVQHCTLYRNGEPLKMSTRKATYITLREILDYVGKDAGRFFFINRSVESHLDFDLDLAVKQNKDNPVFYLQYVAARCAAIARNAAEAGVVAPEELKDGITFAPLAEDFAKVDKDEIDLVRMIGRFGMVVQKSSDMLDQLKIISYLTESAEQFHNYYQRRRVLTEDRAEARARLAVISALRTVFANGLNLLGVSAPEKM
ncbi:MAG: arginine--tRNA ligase [Candidatus Brocadiia bacterium]